MATLAFLDKLNPREKKLALALGGLVAFMLLIAGPVLLQSLVYSRKSDNDDMRAALSAVQSARGQVRERQARKSGIAQRYAKRAPSLAGYLEQAARGQKLEVSDSADRPDVPHGKRYVERNTIIHLKKSGMYAIAKFLEGLEKSEYPVSVSRLSIRKRAGEPDSYDVEVGVSAFDRNEQAAADDKEKKGAP
jgi:general secretion pathway protein M